MDKKDQEIQTLQQTIENLQRELAKARALQFKLFKCVPPDKLLEIMRDTPEIKQ